MHSCFADTGQNQKHPPGKRNRSLQWSSGARNSSFHGGALSSPGSSHFLDSLCTRTENCDESQHHRKPRKHSISTPARGIKMEKKHNTTRKAGQGTSASTFRRLSSESFQQLISAEKLRFLGFRRQSFSGRVTGFVLTVTQLKIFYPHNWRLNLR